MPSPPRVLIVCGSAPPMNCGVGDYAASLTRALAAEGMPVSLLTSRWPGRKTDEPALAGVRWCEPIEHWDWGSFNLIRKAVLDIEPDLLHLQYPAQGYDGRLTALLTQWFRHWLRKPVVVTLHEHIAPFDPILMMAQAAHAVVSVRPDFPKGYRRLCSWTVALKPFHFIPVAPSLPAARPTRQDVAAVRARLGVPAGKSIVAYFGFIYSRRGVEQLFQIADPDKDHLVVVGGNLDEAREYGQHIAELAGSAPWRGRATLTGFLATTEAAMLLACADAILLPFTGEGGGVWNTSIQAARLQETFVLTTAHQSNGYDATHNVYWAHPGNIGEMRAALRQHLGTRRPGSADDVPRWDQIARQHRSLYESLVFRRKREH